MAIADQPQIDFDFIYGEVADKYGRNGNVSVPPPVILKLMLLLVFYNVRSERELMDTLPERLDWLWFLGYDLDADIPDHSILSKARKADRAHHPCFLPPRQVSEAGFGSVKPRRVRGLGEDADRVIGTPPRRNAPLPPAPVRK